MVQRGLTLHDFIILSGRIWNSKLNSLLQGKQINCYLSYFLNFSPPEFRLKRFSLLDNMLMARAWTGCRKFLVRHWYKATQDHEKGEKRRIRIQCDYFIHSNTWHPGNTIIWVIDGDSLSDVHGFKVERGRLCKPRFTTNHSQGRIEMMRMKFDKRYKRNQISYILLIN